MILFSEFGIIHDVTARRPERLDDPCLVTKLVALFERYRLRPAGSGGKRKPERPQNAGDLLRSSHGIKMPCSASAA